MNSETSRMDICYRTCTSANTFHSCYHRKKSVTSTLSVLAYIADTPKQISAISCLFKGLENHSAITSICFQ